MGISEIGKASEGGGGGGGGNEELELGGGGGIVAGSGAEREVEGGGGGGGGIEGLEFSDIFNFPYASIVSLPKIVPLLTLNFFALS